MLRINFDLNKEDCGYNYNPIKQSNIEYRCYAENKKFYFLVAFSEKVDDVKELWPNAYISGYIPAELDGPIVELEYFQ